MFRSWFGVSRLVYNETVNHYNDKEKDTINWMKVAKLVLQCLSDKEYVRNVPYQIKKIAVKDCYQSFINGCRKAKSVGVGFKLSYKTKKNPKQSCYIPKSALSENGIYYTISGKLKMKELSLIKDNECQDLRLVCENGRWFLMIPIKFTAAKKLATSENQRVEGDIVAIDEGIRTFCTFFSENGYFGKIGNNCFQRVMKINTRIDKLVSKISVCKCKKRKRVLRRALLKARFRLRNLVDELHNKVVNFFSRNFSVVVLPPFNVKDMTKKGKRKIRKNVVRAMLSLRFFDFARKMQEKCAECGTLLVRCSEAYTSKTNSFNGELINIGSKKCFKYEGITVDRDINGARNILLRAVRDSSACG